MYLGEAALPARTRLTKLPANARPLKLAAAAMQGPAVREEGQARERSRRTNSSTALGCEMGEEVEREWWWVSNSLARAPFYSARGPGGLRAGAEHAGVATQQ